MCPVCTVTVIAGLGISRLLGIDDLITSIWIGGFVLSFSFITVSWMEKQKWFSRFSKSVHQYISPSVIVLVYLLVLVPLYLNHTIGIKRNTLWGIDKIILGIFAGSAVFLAGVWADKKARKIHGGKQFIKFQKVIFPVVSLIIISVIFYLIIKH